MATMNMVQAINSAMATMMEKDKKVVVFGEDVGFFGGVFRATEGLQAKFGVNRCFDAPITFFACLVTYAYFRTLTSAKWLPFLGLTYGLALATKHNAWLFPIVFFIHFVWVALCERGARKRGEGKKVSYLPWWLLAMAVIGPIVFVASWPWLWNDGVERFRFDFFQRLQDMDMAKTLPVQSAQRTMQLLRLLANDVRAEIPVGARLVPVMGDMLWQIQNDSHGQAVKLASDLDECLSRFRLHIGGIDHREFASRQPLAHIMPA